MESDTETATDIMLTDRVKQLFSELANGTDKEKSDAAVEIGGDRNISLLMSMEEKEPIVEKAIKDLINLLETGSDDSQGSAAEAFGSLARDKWAAKSIAASGAIKALITVLETGSDTVKGVSAYALCEIARTKEIIDFIVSEGAIKPLTDLLNGGSSEGEVAGRALKQLHSKDTIKERIKRVFNLH